MYVAYDFSCCTEAEGLLNVLGIMHAEKVVMSRKMVQDRDVLLYTTTRKQYIAHEIAPFLTTLFDLQHHSLLQAFSNAISHTAMQKFTKLQLILASQGPSVTAETIVQF